MATEVLIADSGYDPDNNWVILRGFGPGGEDRLAAVELLGGWCYRRGEQWLYARAEDLGEPDAEEYDEYPAVRWRRG